MNIRRLCSRTGVRATGRRALAALPVVIGLVLGACGSSGSSQSTKGAAPFDVVGSLAWVALAQQSIFIQLTDVPFRWTCNSSGLRNMKGLQFQIVLSGTSPDGGAATSACLGTYPVTEGLLATADCGTSASVEVEYFTQDAMCDVTERDDGVSGTFTLTALSASELSASYDVTFADAAHLTGSFRVAPCTPATPPPGSRC